MSGRFMPDRGYFIFESISFVVAALYFCNNSKAVTNIIAQWALILTLNNLSDELFFNPCELGWNEIVITTIATIRAIRQLMKHNGRIKR